METGVGGEALRTGLQGAAAIHQDLLQAIQVGEGTIGHWLIDEHPESLGRLQLGRVGGAGRPTRSPPAPAGAR